MPAIQRSRKKKTSGRAKTRRPSARPTKKTAKKGRPKPVSRKKSVKKKSPAKVRVTATRPPTPPAGGNGVEQGSHASAGGGILRSSAELLSELPYREGSFVVHPKYGLGKIERIVNEDDPVPDTTSLEIHFPYQEMKLTLPVEQVERSGMRRPIARKEIDRVYRVLKGRATIDAKRRSAKRVLDYRKRLSLGDPTSLAEAVRDLGRLSLKKSLSYEERKILGTALRILSREVALARGREPEDVRKEIENIVYR
jgi:CarD family transcriptional regulator